MVGDLRPSSGSCHVVIGFLGPPSARLRTLAIAIDGLDWSTPDEALIQHHQHREKGPAVSFNSLRRVGRRCGPRARDKDPGFASGGSFEPTGIRQRLSIDNLTERLDYTERCLRIDGKRRASTCRVTMRGTISHSPPGAGKPSAVATVVMFDLMSWTFFTNLSMYFVGSWKSSMRRRTCAAESACRGPSFRSPRFAYEENQRIEHRSRHSMTSFRATSPSSPTAGL